MPSAGHASMLPCPALHLADLRGPDGAPAVTIEDIRRLRQLGGRCPGHPNHHVTAGVETTTAPLGQGAADAVADVAELWRRGSVISSWLRDLSAYALARDEGLSGFTDHVGDGGEGHWTVLTAVEEAVSAEVLTAALYARFRSRRGSTHGEKMLSAMRAGFGGHVEAEATLKGAAA